MQKVQIQKGSCQIDGDSYLGIFNEDPFSLKHLGKVNIRNKI